MTGAVITRDDIESILSNCDIAYWGTIKTEPDSYSTARKTLGKDNPPYEEILTEILYTGGTLNVIAGKPDGKYVLTLEKLIKGINMAIDQQYCYDRTWWSVNNNAEIELYDDEMDGEVCDCIIQLALFGKVTFWMNSNNGDYDDSNHLSKYLSFEELQPDLQDCTNEPSRLDPESTEPESDKKQLKEEPKQQRKIKWSKLLMRNKLKSVWDVVQVFLIIGAVIGYIIWAFKNVQAYKVIIFAVACIYFGFQIGYSACEDNNKEKDKNK